MCETEPCYGSTSIQVGNATGIGNLGFGVLNGASGVLVGSVYGGVLALSAAMVGLQWWNGRRPAAGTAGAADHLSARLL